MTKTKVAIIGTVGIPAKYGGFETLAEHLVDHLGNELSMSVYCTTKKYSAAQRQSHYKGARLIYLPFDANGLQSIVYDCVSILHALFYADVLLILGVSGGFMLPFVRWFTRKKIIVSIDGIEWKRDKWSKLARWYLWAAEWLAVRYSHADISDNESIQNYTAIRYKTLSQIIEYGADHTMAVRPSPEDRKRYPFLAKPYAFTVCRIEPENNIHLVLEAFARLPRHTLALVGNWANSEYGLKLRQRYQPCPNLLLLDPIYDQRELDLLRSNCLVYIHGHSAGGTNPSLVEAMYLGLPIMAFDVTYNRTTTENKASFFRTADELVSHIQGTSVVRLKQQAAVMKEIAYRRYNWAIIAQKYAYLVRQVVQTPAKSSLVAKAGTRIPSHWLVQAELAHLQVPIYFYE
jgi:glycosyltransferase involved in cell wall biosynthesis